MTKQDTQVNRKKLRGEVVSTDMDKTVRVAVGRFEKHPRYLKYVKKQNQFLAHDESESASVGDEVVIEETSPISKHKAFKVVDVSSK